MERCHRLNIETIGILAFAGEEHAAGSNVTMFFRVSFKSSLKVQAQALSVRILECHQPLSGLSVPHSKLSRSKGHDTQLLSHDPRGSSEYLASKCSKQEPQV